MTDKKSSLEEKLALLQKTYYEKLPGRIDEIESLWVEMKKNWETGPAESMHRLIHSIAGSGGTFGSIEITTTARKLETIFKTILNENRTPSAEEIPVSDELFVQLKQLSLTPPKSIAELDAGEKKNAQIAQ